MEREEKPRSRLPLILLGLFAAGGVALVAVVGYLGYTGWQAFQAQTRAALEANPVIRENLGRIESLEFDLSKSSEFEDINTFVMRVHGTLGDGEVTAALVTKEEDIEELVDGELRLEDGRVLPLFPEAGSAAPEGAEPAADASPGAPAQGAAPERP
jgi:hypothetical protein